ncbi:MAG: hypothetical protein QXU95_00285 [Candidatus Bathyarchaeia archaeon]
MVKTSTVDVAAANFTNLLNVPHKKRGFAGDFSTLWWVQIPAAAPLFGQNINAFHLYFLTV